MLNFGEEHAVYLPGRIPGHRDTNILLLPSFNTKYLVYKVYVQACVADDIGHIGKSLFFQLWNELVPYIVVSKPMADLCWVCQERNQYAVHMREGDEEQALVQANIAVEEHMQHLRNAFDEHNYYKRQCEKAREDARRVIDGFEKRLPCSFDGVAHYSWDYAQQTHYPLNPLQPGPIYFKTPRKCGIFGVCNDGINLQLSATSTTSWKLMDLVRKRDCFMLIIAQVYIFSLFS